MIDSNKLAEWVTHVFDHPVTEPGWFYEANAPLWRSSDLELVTLIAVTCERSGELAGRFSDEQIAQGFGFMLSAGCSGYTNALRDRGVPWPERRRALRSFAAVFEQVIRPRCPNLLFHAEEEGLTALNACAYIWWDNLGWESESWGESSDDPHLAEFDAELLDVLATILRMPHDPCRESALHGLSHRTKIDPKKPVEIIDRFVNETTGLRPELVTFAGYAREGKLT